MPYLVTLVAILLAACSSDTSAVQRTTAVDSTVHPVAPGDTTVAHVDWLRFGVDVGRSSDLAAPTGITAANVGALHRQQVSIDGTVDASPIYLHAVQIRGKPHDAFFVTTTYGKTLAIDADSGTVLWEYTPATYGSVAGSRQITTSTPVADPDRQFIYAASADGHVQKLAVADGHVVWSTAITQLPTREKIASPLNYFNGSVVAVTGGYIGDAPPYQGHVAILDAATGSLAHVWNSLCSDQHALLDPSACSETRSAIWGRAGAVIDSATGNIFVATGNATWDGRTNWGDAVIELSPDATQIVANYTPSNTAQLDDEDADIGSTSPVLLGGGFIAQGGKDGKIRVLSLQQIAGTTPHKGGEAQVVSTPSGADLFTAPAVARAGTPTLYAADGGGTEAWGVSGGQLQPLWKNGNAGTSPVVAGGLLYVYDPGGSLRVYDPPTGHLVATLAAGSGHWNSPIVVDGRIALPEGSSNAHATRGVLDIWRLH
jgi:outer membrane protein assembly factor BamB